MAESNDVMTVKGVEMVDKIGRETASEPIGESMFRITTTILT